MCTHSNDIETLGFDPSGFLRPRGGDISIELYMCIHIYIYIYICIYVERDIDR